MHRFVVHPAHRASLLLIMGLAVAAAVALLDPARLIAQIEGDRGIAPIASGGDLEVTGIDVVTQGKTGEEARLAGWKDAQRKGWEKLWAQMNGGTPAPRLADATIQGMVSAVVVEREQIGPRRYIARLGILFDRARAGQLLGVSGSRPRSAPLLVIPVLYSGGTGQVFETRNPWQRAWAEYRTGDSTIDYVRPSGSGGESVLLTAGQVSRRSRVHWRNILDQFGAADVIMPIARLERQFPGGPVRGYFTARYGPDDKFLADFSLIAPSEEALPAMLQQAIARFDRVYTDALIAGTLTPDKTLVVENELDPELIAALIKSRVPAASERPSDAGPARDSDVPLSISVPVQFSSPDAAAIDATIASVRSAPGVTGVITSSVAVGGTSILRVSYSGGMDGLRAALASRGWQVQPAGAGLSIQR